MKSDHEINMIIEHGDDLFYNALKEDILKTKQILMFDHDLISKIQSYMLFYYDLDIHIMCILNFSLPQPYQCTFTVWSRPWINDIKVNEKC